MGQAISAWPFVFAVPFVFAAEEALDSPMSKIFPSAAWLGCVLFSELIFMDVRTATNEQILTWTLGRTFGHSESEAADTLLQISDLASQHSAVLFRVAFSVLRQASDAEDVVQETLDRKSVV